MAAFGREKERLFRDFLKLKHSIPSHDTFSEIFRVIDPKALDAAFCKVLADVAALLKDGDETVHTIIRGNLLEAGRALRQQV
jgi:hypothetical protein